MRTPEKTTCITASTLIKCILHIVLFIYKHMINLELFSSVYQLGKEMKLEKKNLFCPLISYCITLLAP